MGLEIYLAKYKEICKFKNWKNIEKKIQNICENKREKKLKNVIERVGRKNITHGMYIWLHDNILHLLMLLFHIIILTDGMAIGVSGKEEKVENRFCHLPNYRTGMVWEEIKNWLIAHIPVE